MKKALLILLLTISPAFADDQNVYDFFRQIEPKWNSAVLDEYVTALIKRHMANLFYPVDMTSFVRPEKDAKFREQIIALQKQMEVPPTGALTSDEFSRLEKAARDVDDRPIGTHDKFVDRSKDGEWVFAIGTGGADDIAKPINITQIFCRRASGTCELSTAEYSPEDSQLYFGTPPFDYAITTWEPTRVTATREHPCGTAVMSIDMQTGLGPLSYARSATTVRPCGGVRRALLRLRLSHCLRRDAQTVARWND